MTSRAEPNWVAPYLALQGVLGLAWWGMLAAVPDTRRWFEPESGGPGIVTFALADVSLYGVGSLAVAWLVRGGSRHSAAAAWALAGVVTYATLWCIQGVLVHGVPWFGAGGMTASAALTIVAAVVVGRAHDPLGAALARGGGEG